jgi:hypothetical protein
LFPVPRRKSLTNLILAHQQEPEGYDVDYALRRSHSAGNSCLAGTRLLLNRGDITSLRRSAVPAAGVLAGLVREAGDWPARHVRGFGLTQWALLNKGAGWSHDHVCPEHGIRLTQKLRGWPVGHQNRTVKCVTSRKWSVAFREEHDKLRILMPGVPAITTNAGQALGLDRRAAVLFLMARHTVPSARFVAVYGARRDTPAVRDVAESSPGVSLARAHDQISVAPGPFPFNRRESIN